MGSPIDVNGDGLIDMRIDAVEQANQELRAATDHLAQRWQTLKAEIAAQLGKLTPDSKMSTAFRQGYNEREHPLLHGAKGDDGIEGKNGFIEGYQAFPAKVDEAIAIYRKGELAAVQELFRADP